MFASTLNTLFILSLFLVVIIVNGQDKNVGEGIWSVLNMEQCENPDSYPTKLLLSRKRVNRTVDGFDVQFTVKDTIDGTYGVVIDICKYVEGGCKPYQTVTEVSFCECLKKYSADNFYNVLEGLGVVPNDCPIAAGDYALQDYIFDYHELPASGVYGKFGSQVTIFRGSEKIACVYATVLFEEE